MGYLQPWGCAEIWLLIYCLQRESNFMASTSPLTALCVCVNLLHCVRVRNLAYWLYASLYASYAHTHIHKAVTGRVEDKKLLSRQRQPNCRYLHVVGNCTVTTWTATYPVAHSHCVGIKVAKQWFVAGDYNATSRWKYSDHIVTSLLQAHRNYMRKLVLYHLKGHGLIFCFHMNWRFLFWKKTHIFLITHMESYSWNIFCLEKTCETQVNSNLAYTVRYRQQISLTNLTKIWKISTLEI